MNALDRAAQSDMDLRLLLTVIVAVAVIGLAWTLWLIARERRRPASPITARAMAVASSAVTRDLAASAARAVAGAGPRRIRSSPVSRTVTHHSRRTPRRPGRLAALLGGLAMRVGRRGRRVVPWVDPTPPTADAEPVVSPEPAPAPSGRHHLDSPTRPLPKVDANRAYRPVTVTGRVVMPPPWRPAADPGDVVAAAFADAGLPVDALSAAVARGAELRRWNESRAADPEATELLHRIGPDDGRMVSESDRWPQ